MGETVEAPDPGEHHGVPEVEPVKSAVASRGLIALPDVLAFWCRRAVLRAHLSGLFSSLNVTPNARAACSSGK